MICTNAGSPVTDYTVALDGSGDYTTIQSAIDAAANNGGKATIWLKNGTYIENLTLHSGINIVGSSGLGDLGDVQITGTHTPPLSGHIILRNIRWNSPEHVLYSEKPGTSHITFIDTLLNVTNGYACYLPYWNGTEGGVLEFEDISAGLPNQSQDGGIYNPYGRAQVFLYNAGIGMGNEQKMHVSGNVNMLAGSINCPFHLDSGAVLGCDSSLILRGMVFNGNSEARISNSRITSDSEAAILMKTTGKVEINSCVIECCDNPTISGNNNGELRISGCTFPKNANISSSISPQITGSLKVGYLEVSPGQVKIFSGLGSPTSKAPKGSLYLRIDGNSNKTRVYVNVDDNYEWTPLITER